MKIYDFKNLEKCFVCGNIDKNMDKFIQLLTSNLSHYEKVEHPKEIERQERLRNRQQTMVGLGGVRPLRRSRDENELRTSIKKMFNSQFGDNGYNNSVIIVSGNCGIGTKGIKYYEQLFDKLNKALVADNCFVLFVRGNNDDPSIFNECKIDLSNIKTIPDYSVVILKSFNCLCIGGSVSLDKEWKLSQEETFGKKLFWKNEEPYFDEKTLDEILKKYEIGCVITSTSPSFAFPGTNAFNKSKWVKDNKTIKRTFSNERKILDKIYDKIIDCDTKPYVWIYGRFKQHNHTKVNDIVFDSLASFQFEDVRNLISSYFGIDVSKKLGGNIFTFDTFICSKEESALNGRGILNEPIAEGEDDVEGEAVDEFDDMFDNNEAVQDNNDERPRMNYEVRLDGGWRNVNQQIINELRQNEAANMAEITWNPESINWVTTANIGETPNV